MCTRKKNLNSLARAKGVQTIGVRNMKKQKHDCPVGHPIPTVFGC